MSIFFVLYGISYDTEYSSKDISLYAINLYVKQFLPDNDECSFSSKICSNLKRIVVSLSFSIVRTFKFSILIFGFLGCCNVFIESPFGVKKTKGCLKFESISCRLHLADTSLEPEYVNTIVKLLYIISRYDDRFAYP